MGDASSVSWGARFTYMFGRVAANTLVGTLARMRRSSTEFDTASLQECL